EFGVLCSRTTTVPRRRWCNLLNPDRRKRVPSRLSCARRLFRILHLERLEDRTLLCGSAAAATTTVVPIKPADAITASIRRPGEVDSFKVTLVEPGRLTVRTQPGTGSSLDSRTSLLDSASRLLIHSDGQSASNQDDLITQHLVAGTYFVAVEALGRGTGAY